MIFARAHIDKLLRENGFELVGKDATTEFGNFLEKEIIPEIAKDLKWCLEYNQRKTLMARDIRFFKNQRNP